MVAAILHEHVAYSLWANERFVERLAGEPDAVLDATTASSFATLRLTFMHIRDAESAWACRISGAPMRWPAEESTAIRTVLTQSRRLHDLVAAMDGQALLRECAYRDTKGREHRSPVWRMVMHCVNHGSQHRGQLITQMRQLGLEGIPATDLIVYQRLLAAR